MNVEGEYSEDVDDLLGEDDDSEEEEEEEATQLLSLEDVTGTQTYNNPAAFLDEDG